MVEPAVIKRLLVKLGFLYVAVLDRVVVRYDLEFFSRVVPRIELYCDFVKLGAVIS